MDIMLEQNQESNSEDTNLGGFECAWHRRSVSLEQSQDYLSGLLQIKEQQLTAIFRSPAWKLSKPLRLVNTVAWRLNPDLKRNTHITSNLGLNTTGPTVIEASADRTVIKQTVSFQGNSTSKAFIASWSESGILTNSTCEIAKVLSGLGFEVHLICATPDEVDLKIPDSLRGVATIIQKPNFGYDFGSWSVGVHNMPDSGNWDETLLVNDSCLLVNDALSSVISSCRESPYDITSLTDSSLHDFHLQSYFLHFKNASFHKPQILNFIKNIRSQPTKEAVIFAYELGLSNLARQSGLLTGAIHPWNSIRSNAGNPAIDNWRDLFERRMPLLKREVIRTLDDSAFAELIAMIERDGKLTQSLLADFAEVRELRNS